MLLYCLFIVITQILLYIYTSIQSDTSLISEPELANNSKMYANNYSNPSKMRKFVA